MNAWVNHWPTLSAPVAAPVLRIISHGGGVQTSALCLMAARGDLGPMPDCAIFADTGDEPAAVYEYLDYIAPLLPFPLLRLRRDGRTLGENCVSNATAVLKGQCTIPLHLTPDGIMPKQCSTEWKTRVVMRAAKAMARAKLGLGPRQRFPVAAVIEQWIGISTDEKERVRTNSDRVFYNRYPLIEVNRDRRACLSYLAERQYTKPPRSACVFCPYRGNDEWQEMKDTAPADFAKACAFDAAFRPGWLGMTGEAFVHPSRQPLAEVDFNRADPRQGLLGFINECSGTCGV